MRLDEYCATNGIALSNSVAETFDLVQRTKGPKSNDSSTGEVASRRREAALVLQSALATRLARCKNLGSCLFVRGDF